jgi:hypothetical protein
MKDYKVFNMSLWPERQVQVGIETARSRYFNRVPVGFMSTRGIPKIYLGTNLIRWAGKPLKAVPTGTPDSKPVGSTHDLRERDMARRFSFNPGKHPVHAYQLKMALRMYTPAVDQQPHFVPGGATHVVLPNFLACARKNLGKFRLRPDGADAVETVMRMISPEAKKDHQRGTDGADNLLHLYRCSIDANWPAVCGEGEGGLYKVGPDGELYGHTEIDGEDVSAIPEADRFLHGGRWFWQHSNRMTNPEKVLLKQLQALFVDAPYAVCLEPLVGTTFEYKPAGASLWRPRGLKSEMLPADLAGNRDYRAWKMIAALTTLKTSGENVYISFDLVYNGFMPWVDWETPEFSPVQSVYSPRSEMACRTSGVEMDLLNFDVVCNFRDGWQDKKAAFAQAAPKTVHTTPIDTKDPALAEPEVPEAVDEPIPEITPVEAGARPRSGAVAGFLQGSSPKTSEESVGEPFV